MSITMRDVPKLPCMRNARVAAGASGLDKVSSLPAHQRSVDSLLRIISDRLHLSVIIVDSAWHLLHFASWPELLDLYRAIALERLLED